MKEWFIGDNHFGHANIIEYENRPFASVQDMDWNMVENWNAVVDKDDMVFHLGDFSFYNKEDTKKIVEGLRGRIVLIKGNHDTHSNAWYRDVGFYEVVKWPIIRHGFLILSHEPVYLQAATPYRNIHGHIHGIRKNDPSNPGKFFNASVEVNDYTPVEFHDLFKFLEHSDLVEEPEPDTRV